MFSNKADTLRTVDGVTFPEVPLEKLIWMLEIYLQTAGDTLKQRPNDASILFLATLSGNSLAYLRVLNDSVRGLENARDAFMREHLKNAHVSGRRQ